MPDSTLPASSAPGGSRMETLYGSDQFQINLWHLPPQAALAFEPVHPHHWLCIQGCLDVIEASFAPQALPAGQYSKNPRRLQNNTPEPAVALEATWQANSTPRPLPEITETRPWGSFTVLKDEPAYKLKQLRVKPGNRLSLQRHQKREEHWLVIAGNPEMSLDDSTYHLQPGSYIHIPLQSWHRIANPDPSAPPVEIIELQLGTYFGEDDIERREDDYGRHSVL